MLPLKKNMAANKMFGERNSLFWFLCCFIVLWEGKIATSAVVEDVTNQLREDIANGKVLLNRDITKYSKNLKVTKDILNIYCHPGLPRRDLWRLWTTYSLKLGFPMTEYQVYSGPNATDVYDQHVQARRSWFSHLLPWRTESVPLHVFDRTCIGITSPEEFKVVLFHKAIDPWLVGYLFTGLTLLMFADRLSRNVMFYYGTGISFGLLASLLIVVFIMGRMMPKKYGAMAVIVGGWSAIFYLLQYFWENIQKLLEDYIEYVAGYFVVAGILSFAVLYYKGPVTNPRMINLIKWALQAVALVLIYNGTQIPAVSVTIVGIIVLLYLLQLTSFSLRSHTFWWRWFPRFVPSPKLLTEEEYMHQGREETKRALLELREHCRSPDCDAWKTMSRLHTPQRFAQWVDGGSHLSDEELYAFDSDPAPLNFEESDESEMSFRLSSM